MRVGVVSFADVDYGLDLPNVLNERHVSVSLYLSRRHVITVVDSPDRPAERVYDLGLLDPAVRLYLYQLPRMRDPRSIAGVRRLSQSMADDGIDVAHIMMGGGEIWLAVLAYLLRQSHDLPVASTMIVPRPNPREYPPPFVQLLANKLVASWSDVIIANGRNEVELVQKLYRVPGSRLWRGRVWLSTLQWWEVRESFWRSYPLVHYTLVSYLLWHSGLSEALASSRTSTSTYGPSSASGEENGQGR